MRMRSAEWLFQRQVGDQAKFFVGPADDRPQLERQGIFLGRAPHVCELDIAAELHRPLESLRDGEMDLGPRARVFVLAIGKLGGREILAYLDPVHHAVSSLESLVYLMHDHLALRRLT